MSLDTWINHLNRPTRTPHQELERRLNHLLIGEYCHTLDLPGLPNAIITRTGQHHFEVHQGKCLYKAVKSRKISTAIQDVLAHFAGRTCLPLTVHQPVYEQLELL